MAQPCSVLRAASCSRFVVVAVLGAALLKAQGYSLATSSCYIAGVYAMALKLFQLLLEPVWYFYLRPATSFEDHRGDWAVVTGASQGLGRGYAVAVARRGLNVVLLARNKENLERVASECHALGARTHIIIVDFIDEESSLWSRITDEIQQLDGCVSVLINNVGGRPLGLPCVPMPCYCEGFDSVTYESFYKFNAAPSIHMTQMLLHGMVKQDKGYVLNVSSINGLQNCPYLAPYSASKAYVSSFSECLNKELKGRGSRVHVESVCPGPVATAGIGRAGLPSDNIPDPIVFAERSLALAKSAYAQVPYSSHWWAMQSLGPNSRFLSTECTESRLYKSMDYSKFLG